MFRKLLLAGIPVAAGDGVVTSPPDLARHLKMRQL